MIYLVTPEQDIAGENEHVVCLEIADNPRNP